MIGPAQFTTRFPHGFIVNFTRNPFAMSCRTCLGSPAEKDITELDKKYPNIMLFCLDIKVTGDSKVTTKLCHSCNRKIIAFFKFKSQSLKNDAYLKTLDPSKFVDEKCPIDEYVVKQENMTESENFGDSLSENCNVEIKIEIDNVKENDMDDMVAKDFESDEEPLSVVQKVKYEYVKEEIQIEAPKKKRGRPKKPSNPKIVCKEERQMCEECGKSVRNLKEHSLQHRPREERRVLRCKECPKVFISLGGRNRHYKSAHLGLRSKCDICSKEVRCLSVHKLQVHNPQAMLHGCLLCPRRFITQSALDAHVLSHTRDYPVECDACHKKFRSKNFLSRHIRQVHDKETRYQCQFCSKGFFTKEHLKRHVRVHTNERPYTCEKCGNAFADKRTLKNHLLIHFGVKSFRCKVCHMTFMRSGYLKVHMLSHTKEKNHPCRYCGVRFGRSDHRNRHEFTAHQKHAG